MQLELELSETDAILFGIRSLLDTYETHISRAPTEAFINNDEYMNISEMFFVVKNLRDMTDNQLYQACYNPPRLQTSSNVTKDSSGQTSEVQSGVQSTVQDTNRLVQQLKVLSSLLKTIRAYRDSRLLASSKTEESKPRLVKLCEAYKLSHSESDLLHIVVIMQGSNNSHVLNSLVELDYMRRIFKYQRLAGMSEVDLTFFCDQERSHMKESIITVEEENGFYFNLKLQQVAVQLMYGKKVRTDDLLKISQTSVEGILAAELANNGQVMTEMIQSAAVTSGATPFTKAAKAKGKTSEPTRGRKRPRDLEVGDRVALIGDEGILDGDGNIPETPSRSKVARTQETTHNHNILLPSEKDDLSMIRIASRTSSFRRSVPNTPSTKTTSLHRQLSNSSHTSNRLSKTQSLLLEEGNDDESDSDNAEMDEDNSDDENDDEGLEKDLKNSEEAGMDEDEGTNHRSAAAHLAIDNPDQESSLKPYDSTNQLDYLEDGFQLISLLIKNNTAKLKDDLKKEGTSNASMWHDSEAKVSNRELSAKVRLHEKRIATRLQKTKDAQLPLPRLETLMETFQADIFEKRLVLLLIGLTVSPIVRTLVDNMKSGHIVDNSISVGEVLSILSQDFKSQLTHRRYFYQSSCLLVNGVISLFANRWREGGGDLTENRLALDRRILDWTVGLDSEIHELVQGSDLYEPVVQLEQVILPRGYIDRILSLCIAYDDYALHQDHMTHQAQKISIQQQFSSFASATSATNTGAIQQHKQQKTLSYGHALVILLCGKSGTGKTMTVNAVAKELQKKVLLVDFQSLVSRRGGAGQGGEAEIDLKGLFREAKMSNAVLFFDECETIFRSRNIGADRTLNALLTEMERHTGIVFLATNRPHDIDEAMHRRITMVLEYREPTVAMRKLIWDNLLAAMQTTTAASSIQAADNTSHDDEAGGNHASATTKTTAGEATAEPVNSENSATVNLVGTIKRSKPRRVCAISIDSDVETSVLAAKYQLTGGFIKNAVLSATLIAMSRNKTHPVIRQDDLIAGSSMQMRGNLSRNVFRIIPTDTDRQKTLNDLFLPESMRLVLSKVIQFESTRNKVYGTWNFTQSAASTGDVGAAASTSNAQLMTIQQHACINLLAGSRGSGKNTILRTVASALGGRKLKYVHVAELASDNIAASTETFHALVLDASILDAIIVIDGFEQILESAGGGGGGHDGATTSLHLVLSRLMDILYTFPGCIFLLAHIENPQNMELKRDFASRLFSFIRVTMPSFDIRANLWRSLLPKAAPLATDIDFTSLGRKFELFPVSIEAAIAYACSEVAARNKTPFVTQQDLVAAGEREVKKLRSNNFEIVSGLFN